jgi:LysM repeat protein
VNPSALVVGQQICIPSSNAGSYSISGVTTGCTYYTIKSGQTYYSLSGGNSALISQLTVANPSLNPSNLAVGQTICIPTQYYSSYILK